MTEKNDSREAARESGGALFERYNNRDVFDLIREHPLAWVSPRDGDPMNSASLPLLAETDGDGRVCTLVGHMARRNPLFHTLSEKPHALILFMGPQAYVSPAYVTDPAWAPSWNYAQARIEATVRFEPDATDEVLRMLLEAMEHHVPSGWTPANMGARYPRMQQSIIAFRAQVTNLRARFKLGQDEKPERLREILTRHPDQSLVSWMRRFNADR